MSEPGLFKQFWIRFNSPTEYPERLDGLDDTQDVVAQFQRNRNSWTAYHFTSSLLVNHKLRKVSSPVKDVSHANYVDFFNLKFGDSSQTLDFSSTTIQNSLHSSKHICTASIVSLSTFPYSFSSRVQTSMEKNRDVVEYCPCSDCELQFEPQWIWWNQSSKSRRIIKAFVKKLIAVDCLFYQTSFPFNPFSQFKKNEINYKLRPKTLLVPYKNIDKEKDTVKQNSFIA